METIRALAIAAFVVGVAPGSTMAGPGDGANPCRLRF